MGTKVWRWQEGLGGRASGSQEAHSALEPEGGAGGEEWVSPSGRRGPGVGAGLEPGHVGSWTEGRPVGGSALGRTAAESRPYWQHGPGAWTWVARQGSRDLLYVLA